MIGSELKAIVGQHLPPPRRPSTMPRRWQISSTSSPPSWCRRASTNTRVRAPATTQRCCSRSRRSSTPSTGRAGTPIRSDSRWSASWSRACCARLPATIAAGNSMHCATLVLSVFDRYPVPAALGESHLERCARRAGAPTAAHRPAPPQARLRDCRSVREGLLRPDADQRETAPKRVSHHPRLSQGHTVQCARGADQAHGRAGGGRVAARKPCGQPKIHGLPEGERRQRCPLGAAPRRCWLSTRWSSIPRRPGSTRARPASSRSRWCRSSADGSTADAACRRLVRPDVAIPAQATRIHGIDAAAVADAPRFAEVWPELACLHRRTRGDRPCGRLRSRGAQARMRARRPVMDAPARFDTRLLAEVAAPDLAGYSLENVAAWLDDRGRRSPLRPRRRD